MKKDKVAFIIVSVGEFVEVGQVIAKEGNLGTTSEPHLHIQYQRNSPFTMGYSNLSEGLPIKPFE